VALSSVWFYRQYLRRSVLTFVGLGILRLLGGLYMSAIFFYGLTTQTAVVAWVSVAGVALAFGIGAFIVWRAAPTSPFFAEIEERRKADLMAGPDAELSARTPRRTRGEPDERHKPIRSSSPAPTSGRCPPPGSRAAR
jgi:hypothetical protein